MIGLRREGLAKPIAQCVSGQSTSGDELVSFSNIPNPPFTSVTSPHSQVRAVNQLLTPLLTEWRQML